MSRSLALIVAVVALAVAMISLLFMHSDRESRERRALEIEQMSGAERQDPRLPDTRRGELDTDAAQPLETPVDFAQVNRDRDLHGIVVTTEDEPVAGATISIVRFPYRRLRLFDDWSLRESEIGPSTRSAIDGTFRIALPRGRVADVRVDARGYGRSVLARRLAGERVRFVLHPEARLELTVKNEQGQPMSGAAVTFKAHARLAELDRRDGESDANGRVVFSRLAPGRGFAFVHRHPRLGKSLSKPVTLQAGETTREVLVVPDGRMIEGIVVDAVNGSPIAGARVGSFSVRGPHTFCDDKGKFALAGWRDDSLPFLYAVAQGHVKQQERVPEQGLMRFELERGCEVRGTVLSQAQEPVHGALVSAVTENARLDTRSARTDEHGAFRLVGVGWMRLHTLIVQADGHGRLLHAFQPTPDEHGVVDLGHLFMPAARRVEGRVLDEGGYAIAGARVLLKDANVDRANVSAPQEEFSSVRERCFTDDLGRFRFCDLSPGTYELELEGKNLKNNTANVVLPEDRDVLDIVLRRDQGGRLTVRVEDEARKPVTKLFVLVRSGESWLSEQTDEQGRTSFVGLNESSVRVHVRQRTPYVKPDPIRATPNGQELVVTLERGARVAGVVLGLDRAPQPDMNVEVRSRGGFTARTWSDLLGNFEFYVPRSELVDLFMNGSSRRSNKVRKGGWTGPARVDVRAELKNILVPADGLVLQARKAQYDRNMSVLVLDPSGRPVEGAHVRVTSAQGVEPQRTDRTGHVRFEGLLPDEVSVFASPPKRREGLFASEVLRVVPNGAEHILRLRGGAWLQGVVLDTSNAPVANGRVVVMGGGLGMASANTGANGGFRLRVPHHPTYTLLAFKDPKKTWPPDARVEDVAPGTTDLLLRLPKQ